MPMLTDLNVVVDKTRVLDFAQCYKNNPGYEEILALYEEILPEFKLLVKPVAAYAFVENAGLNVSEANECGRLVYCVLTLGQAVCDRISECFAEGSYLKGKLINALADELLIYYEQQMYREIKREADFEGCGLTRKLTPGEHGFAADYQEVILDWFLKDVGNTTEDYLLPAKSLVYIYGADCGQLTSEIEHDCLHCDNVNCSMREQYDGGKVILSVLKEAGVFAEVQADKTKTILESLTQGGIYAAAPCNGKGTCGKCKIKIRQGTVRALAPNYEKLQQAEIDNGVYLACQTYPQEDVSLELLDIQEENFSITAGVSGPGDSPLNSGFSAEKIVLSDAWQSAGSLTDYIDSNFKNIHHYTKRALTRLSVLAETAEAKAACLIINKGAVVDVCPLDKARMLGLAIDIGTTTIVISLVDLLNGTVIDSYAALNSQRQYGADVITRIQCSMSGGALKLKECICRDIIDGIDAIARDEKEYIQHVVVTGNTTMLYLLLGLSVSSLAAYPFRTTTTGLLEFPFFEVFNHNVLDCLVTIMPGLSAYVGADTIAGLLECGFGSADTTCMLIDIGTNGEMVIGSKNKFMCLAAAAGPAFEGASMTSGTGSVKGAVSSFSIDGDKLCFATIQDAPAIGICGSGIIDIVAACLKSNWIDKSGNFNLSKAPGGMLKVAEGPQGDILFTQKDIRELQLAKAAIRTGIDTLIENYGCKYADIDTVYLAGGFGTNIDVDSAAAIGLIPRELKYKVKTVGNSALSGATKYLLNHELCEEINSLRAVAVCLDLANDNKFNSLLIQNMQF